MSKLFGVIITDAASNWQIFRQDQRGIGAISLRGRAVVHGAPGLDPPPVLHDEDTQLPMLAFHGVAVE